MGMRIAIIGAGLSGLLACRYTKEKGFNSVVFEASNDIGGVWSSQTISSTKLQTPKGFYQFSDFPWSSSSVKDDFPHHKQVLEYLKAYAAHFAIVDHIKFNSKVVGIEFYFDDQLVDGRELIDSWQLWGGNGAPFHSGSKWKVIVEESSHDYSKIQEYEVDFVILSIGNYSGLPHIPGFPKNQGPEVFHGKVLHSLQYAAMDDVQVAELITNKKVAVIGFQKSALDIAAEIARKNGARNPCSLLYREDHWIVPDYILKLMFLNLSRFSELMFHKPQEGFLLWLLAFLFTPLRWVLSIIMESYLKWVYPLKEYAMIPDRGFLAQARSCVLSAAPSDFFNKVKEGSLILKRSPNFSFCSHGLIVNGKSLDVDVVIFATGYKTDEKLMNIFSSPTFQEFISGSKTPFYRECIHPKIPQLAILGYPDSASFMNTTEMKSKWLSSFLSGNFKLPSVREMEEDTIKWQNYMKRYATYRYKRSCVSTWLPIYCNDQMCRDMRFEPRRKKGFLAELFSPYILDDYKDLLRTPSV